MEKTKHGTGGIAIAGKKELHFHFHNPNSVEKTADYIAKIFIEANQAKIQRMLMEAANKATEESRSLSD